MRGEMFSRTKIIGIGDHEWRLVSCIQSVKM